MQSIRLASKEWWPRVPTISILFQAKGQQKNGRNPEDTKMLLMSSKVSSEPGRESDVGDSEPKRLPADWKSVPGPTRTMPPSKGSGADFPSPKRELQKAKQGCTGEFISVGSWNWLYNGDRNSMWKGVTPRGRSSGSAVSTVSWVLHSKTISKTNSGFS